MRAIRSLSLMIAVLWPIAAAAQGPLMPSIQRIVDNKEIVVAIIDHDVPPMIVTDKKKILGGFDIKLVGLIGAELGVKVRFVRLPGYDDIIKTVARRDADMGISNISINAQRARSVLFTRPYVNQSKVLLINRVRGLQFRESCPSVDELIELVKARKLLGLIAGGAFEREVIRVVKTPKYVGFRSIDEMMQAVTAGKVMATMQGEVQSRHFLQTHPYAKIRLQLCTIGRHLDRIAMVVRPDAPDLVAWLNALLDVHDLHLSADQVLSGEIENLLR